MKRILTVLCAALVAVSCDNGSRDYYFQPSEPRCYDDPSAELDTLSYAVGMNIGLSLRFTPAGDVFDEDIIVKAFNEEIAKSVVDEAFIAENGKYLGRFSDERMRQHIFAKRLAGMNLGASANVPTLFDNGEFSVEKVSTAYGYDIANHVRKMSYPINLHWFVKAFEDTRNIPDQGAINQNMQVDVETMRNYMARYIREVLPEYVKQRSAEWIRGVAKQRGVHPIVVENDTLYYRIDRAGNGNKIRNERDTVSFNYDVYTQRGTLVESLNERVKLLEEALDKAQNDTTATKPELKAKRIERIEKQLEENKNFKIVLERFIIEGSRYGIQKISEGGAVTLWIPASLAYGEQGNKLVMPNEAIVMTIELTSVVHGKSDEEIAKERAEAMLKSRNADIKPVPVSPKSDASKPTVVKKVVKPTIMKE